MLEYYLLGVAVGAVSEGGARLFRLWLYRNPVYPVANVLVMFGFVMGVLLAPLVPDLGYVPVFLIAGAVGYGYEILNFRVLDWWHFPGGKFLIFRGEQGCSVAVASCWAAVPLIVHFLRGWI